MNLLFSQIYICKHCTMDWIVNGIDFPLGASWAFNHINNQNNKKYIFSLKTILPICVYNPFVMFLPVTSVFK